MGEPGKVPFRVLRVELERNGDTFGGRGDPRGWAGVVDGQAHCRPERAPHPRPQSLSSPPMNFGDRLDAAIEAAGNPVLLGIDPHLELLPEPFAKAADPSVPRAERADAVRQFGLQMVELAAGRVPAIKPQSAFFEQLGADGVRAFEDVVDAGRAAGLLVIGDVKRGDIASTAAAYARAHLAPVGAGASGTCDAITVNPYLGPDTLEPFADVCDEARAGIFVLVRTSNPESSTFQGFGDPPLAERVARVVHRLGLRHVGDRGISSFGAVTGATHPEQLMRWRRLMPNNFLLLPGYGAQGAGAKDVVDAFLPGGRGALVASSRGISFAYRKDSEGDWKQAASRALDGMIADLRGALR